MINRSSENGRLMPNFLRTYRQATHEPLWAAQWRLRESVQAEQEHEWAEQEQERAEQKREQEQERAEQERERAELEHDLAEQEREQEQERTEKREQASNQRKQDQLNKNIKNSFYAHSKSCNIFSSNYLKYVKGYGFLHDDRLDTVTDGILEHLVCKYDYNKRANIMTGFTIDLKQEKSICVPIEPTRCENGFQ
ncbi:hypothetical protein QAD02_018142 [Eretmocerus hayati]|uniref:Uncharacterized protein n=1 Tax=Eretmocerus hayati TaxID=131215 RepID=A0ACC2PKP9_9HYME|nr:hypothetical protein QAD02_018142 [Eretmocerus hayati]